MTKSLFRASFLAALLIAAPASAEDSTFKLILKDHAFAPTDLEIPQGEKVKLTVVNEDATPAEFESHDLKIEKVVGANSEINVFVGPLKPGTYKFVDEFHEDVAKGTITVK